MRNLLILIVSIIAISNFLGISSAKRIKRDIDVKQNRTNIAEDFVLLHAANKKNTETPINKKDNKSLHDAAVVALTTKSSNDDGNKKLHDNKGQTTNDFKSIEKPAVANPLPYVLRSRGQHSPENRNTTQGVFFKLSADNSKSYKSLDYSNDQESSIRNNSEITKIQPSFGQKTANIVGAHVLIPPRFLMSSHTFNPFAPIEQMMKFANTLFYKVGMDDDSAENGNSVVEFNSLDSPSSHMFLHSPIIALAQTSSSHQGQKESLAHSTPGNSRKTSAVRKSIDLVDLIANTFNNPENDETIDEEIEIVCPLHNGKGSTAHENCQMGKGDVVEVCSCHLAKKDKNGSHKDHK